MIDVLLYLFEHYIDDDHNVSRDETLLKDMLKEAGFPLGEINKAFVWLEDLVQHRCGPKRNDVAERCSFRIYSPREMLKINQDCRGYLMLLENSAILNPLTREIVIERAMALEMEDLDLETFKLIIMMVLANQSGNQTIQQWIEALVFDDDSLH